VNFATSAHIAIYHFCKDVYRPCSFAPIFGPCDHPLGVHRGSPFFEMPVL